MTLDLYDGARVKLRNGETFTIRKNDNENYPWKADGNVPQLTWRAAGQHTYHKEPHPLDIIGMFDDRALAEPSPQRRVVMMDVAGHVYDDMAVPTDRPKLAPIEERAETAIKAVADYEHLTDIEKIDRDYFLFGECYFLDDGSGNYKHMPFNQVRHRNAKSPGTNRLIDRCAHLGIDPRLLQEIAEKEAMLSLGTPYIGASVDRVDPKRPDVAAEVAGDWQQRYVPRKRLWKTMEAIAQGLGGEIGRYEWGDDPTTIKFAVMFVNTMRENGMTTGYEKWVTLTLTDDEHNAILPMIERK